MYIIRVGSGDYLLKWLFMWLIHFGLSKKKLHPQIVTRSILPWSPSHIGGNTILLPLLYIYTHTNDSNSESIYITHDNHNEKFYRGHPKTGKLLQIHQYMSVSNSNFVCIKGRCCLTASSFEIHIKISAVKKSLFLI